MKFPLVLFSLFFLLVVLARLIANWRGTPQSAGSGSWAARLEDAYQSTVWVYVLTAGAALLLFFLGKPSRPEQWLVWGGLIVQVVRVLGVLVGQRGAERALAVLIVVMLGVLWFLQLPMFDPIPR